jgi:hypothetical protein
MDTHPPVSARDADFHAWTRRQAELLRAGRLDEADIAHIAEELDDMGGAEKRELVSRLRVLLLHLLKWRFQPERRGASWRASIVNTRDELREHLDDNPSLRATLDAALATAYRRAVVDAVAETGLPPTIFPAIAPWPFERCLSEEFWPDEPG